MECGAVPKLTGRLPGDPQGQWRDAFWTYCQGEIQHVQEEPDTSVSWREVPWDAARQAAAQQFVEGMPSMTQEERERAEALAGVSWEGFYRQHRSGEFFKDRHYLHHQFPELKQGKLDGYTVMEAGCGCGNTLFPLLQEHPNAKFVAFDQSQQAVELVRSHSAFDAARCTVFVW